MRIAFVSYEFPPETPVGGIGTYTKQLADLLAKAGMDVHVFAASHVGSSVAAEANKTVHRIFCRNPHLFQQQVVTAFSDQHRINAFDLIESAEIHGNALEIKKMFPGVPLHVRLHACNYLVESLKKAHYSLFAKLRFVLGALRRGRFDLGHWCRYDYKNDPDYQFANMADFVTVPSVQMKNWAVKNWRMKPARIAVVNNPFVENKGLRTARTANSEQVILFYGRLSVLKGLVTATKAMRHVLRRNPTWKWVVVGDDGFGPNGKGSMKVWMQAELGSVSGQVEFRDAVSQDELPSLLKKTSVVLVPSLFESFSYVTLEAMYAGKALVGSSNTAVENFIKEGMNGLCANPRSVNDWQRAIQKLIDQPEVRKEMGAEASQYAEAMCSANGQIINYYKSKLSCSCQPA